MANVVLFFYGTPIGVLRHNLFWGITPFLTFIYMQDELHRKGGGKQALLSWEKGIKALGFTIALTSTQANEEAQYFCRKLGYQDYVC